MSEPFKETDSHTHTCFDCGGDYICTDPQCDGRHDRCSECCQTLGIAGNEETENLHS